MKTKKIYSRNYLKTLNLNNISRTNIQTNRIDLFFLTHPTHLTHLTHLNFTKTWQGESPQRCHEGRGGRGHGMRLDIRVRRRPNSHLATHRRNQFQTHANLFCLLSGKVHTSPSTTPRHCPAYRKAPMDLALFSPPPV